MRLASRALLRRFCSSAMSSKPKVDLSEEEWKVKLSAEQFRVLRQKGTEKPGTGTPKLPARLAPCVMVMADSSVCICVRVC